MPQKRRRICEYCGLPTHEEIPDAEWEAVGREYEECPIAELANGTIGK